MNDSVQDANDYIETNPDEMEARIMAGLLSNILTVTHQRDEAWERERGWNEAALEQQARAEEAEAALKSLLDTPNWRTLLGEHEFAAAQAVLERKAVEYMASDLSSLPTFTPIFIDDKLYDLPSDHTTGEKLRALAGIKDTHDLWQRFYCGMSEDVLVEGDLTIIVNKAEQFHSTLRKIL